MSVIWKLDLPPQLHINEALPTVEKIVEAVSRGLQKAKDEHNSSQTVKSGIDIPFKFGIILGAMRKFQ